MKRAILVTGLVRNPANFMGLLEEIERARRDFGDFSLIYSTWSGELNAYPEVAKRLGALDAIVVEQEQPNLKLSGHMLHQVLTLEMGLSLLSPDYFVLKLRPDISRAPDVRAFFELAEQSWCDSNYEPASVFRKFVSPVYILGFTAAQAFYIIDITFAGRQRDLVRLCQLSLLSLVKFTRLAPEQLMWSAPFLGENRLFEKAWRCNVGLIFHEPARTATLQRVVRESRVWTMALAEYYHMIAANFSFLGRDVARPDEVEALSRWPLEDLFWAARQLPWVAHMAAVSGNTFMSRSCLEVVMGNLHVASEFGEKFQAAMLATRDGMSLLGRMTIDALERDVEALGRSIEREVGVGGMRYIRQHGGCLEVVGLSPAWSFLDTSDSAVRAAEVEISAMRRVIDALNAELTRSRLSDGQ